MARNSAFSYTVSTRRGFCNLLVRLSAAGGTFGFLSKTNLLTSRSEAETADFFSGKQISLIVGYNPGGTYDVYSRIIADWLPRYIPGKPTIVVQNMPGAGGAEAANYLYSQATKDALTIGMIGQAAALEQVIGDPAVRYDASKFGWIGRATPVVEMSVTWHTCPVKTIEEALHQNVTMACTGAESTAYMMPLLMDRIVGTKFMLVRGYAGTAGCLHAMEQGEVDGAYTTAENLLIEKRKWLEDHLISVLVQYSLTRHPAFPNVPTMMELGKTDEDRKILALFGSPAEIGRSILAPPGVPAGRLGFLRSAFDAMTADPKFKQELVRRNMQFGPMSGPALQKIVSETLDISPSVVSRAKLAVAAN